MKRCSHLVVAIILSIMLIVGLTACQLPTLFPTASPTSTSADTPTRASGATSESPGPASPSASAGEESPDDPDHDYNIDPDPEPEPEPEPIEVQSVAVQVGSDEVARGTTIEPIVTILPEDATDKTYSLKSSDENVLRLENGDWTAVGAGTAEIVAMTTNGQTATVEITVVVPVDNVTLGVREVTLNRGESLALTLAIDPYDASDQSIIFTSSNDNVVRVSEDGTIQGVSVGTAVVEATVDGLSDTCTVTVIVPVTGISISTDKRTYLVGDQGSFTVQISPQDATDRTYTVSITGSAASQTGQNAFSCDTGGESTITITAANGVTARQTINVVDLVALAEEVLRLTNVERANAGLPALGTTPALTQTAVVRANETIRSFSHTRPDGRTCFTAYDENGVSYRWAGENIAMGQRTPTEVVRAWMNSPGHRENILRSDFGHLGVGVAMDSNGRLYWSQNFTD